MLLYLMMMVLLVMRWMGERVIKEGAVRSQQPWPVRLCYVLACIQWVGMSVVVAVVAVVDVVVVVVVAVVVRAGAG